MAKVINSREKGARFERELSAIFKKLGYDTHRSAQYSGKNGDADVVGLPGIHIEAKHQEKMMLYDWMAQAKRDSEKNGRIPAVFHKKNRAAILVTMELDDWMKLYRGETDGKKKDEKAKESQERVSEDSHKAE